MAIKWYITYTRICMLAQNSYIMPKNVYMYTYSGVDD